MRALITGVSGFLGHAVATHLLEHGDSVGGTHRGAAPVVPGADLFAADVLDPASLARAIAEFEPEVVIHLAGLSHVGRSWERPDEYFRVNVLGTENLLAAAPGLRVVIASSAEVYGWVPEEEQPISEERMPAPCSPYALTKAAAERLALGRGAVVARAFNVIGAGQSGSFALPSFASQLAAIRRGEQAPIISVGNLEPRRDFVDLRDAAKGLVVLARSGAAGEIYNLGTGRSTSISEMLEILRSIAAVDVEVVVDGERVRAVDLPLLQADATRLRNLGWSPEHTLEEAIGSVWAAVVGD